MNLSIAPVPSHGLFLDLTGQNFGRLRVNSYAGRISANNQWNCTCDCGALCRVAGGNLRSGHTLSCGCLHREASSAAAKTHGRTKSAEYRTWAAMKSRCQDPSASSFQNYGQRGITVCSRWNNSFEMFLGDMGPRPSKNHSIDRRDVNGNYEPTNCRWATAKEQANNKRNNRWLTINGKTRTLQQWADAAGLDRSVIVSRVQAGISGEALLAPSDRHNYLTYKGITDSYKGWSVRTGIKHETISQRVRRDKWSAAKTLTVGATKCA